MNKDIEGNQKAAAAKLKYEERLADKRRRGAPKREAKAQVKQAQKVAMQKLEEIEAFTIGKKTKEVFNKRKTFNDSFAVQMRTKPEKNEKFGLKPGLSKEGQALQDEALEAIRKGKQSILPVKKVNVSELDRQLKQSAIKEKTRMTNEKNHFYVLDFETTDTRKPEPICLAVLRYKMGKRVDMFKTYFMPEKDIDEKAEKLHKLSKWRLKDMDAKRFSKDSARLFINFINQYPNIPIVAHAVKFDRDRVLMPALSKVNMQHMMPLKTRWRCTLDLSDRIKGLPDKGLETVYTHIGFEERNDDDQHEAEKDCEAAAQIFMHLMELDPITTVEGGFVKK